VFHPCTERAPQARMRFSGFSPGVFVPDLGPE
jgi:hypothetical protein